MRVWLGCVKVSSHARRHQPSNVLAAWRAWDSFSIWSRGTNSSVQCMHEKSSGSPAVATGSPILIAPHGAARMSGVLALRSAAIEHGWPLKIRPPIPEVAVPRNRKVVRRKGAAIRVGQRSSTHHCGQRLLWRLILACARSLPFDEALTIADAGLRSGAGHPHRRWSRQRTCARGAGAARVRKVARHANAEGGQPVRVGAPRAHHRGRSPLRAFSTRSR